MKTKIIYTVFLLFIIISSCSLGLKISNIANTKWVYNLGNCKDCIRFIDSENFLFSGCETGDTIFGTYLVLKDTIVLTQLSSYYEKTSLKESTYDNKVRFKLTLKKRNKLIIIERQEYKVNKWIKTNFRPETEYFFTRE